MELPTWLRYLLIVLFLIAIAIVIPFIIEERVFDSEVPSKVSNDGWASFLGGFIGSIIALLGVILTIENLKLENKKSNEQNEKRILKEKRLEVIPYLSYSFNDAEAPESYSLIPVGIEDYDIEYDYFVKAHSIKVTNFGLGAACRLFCKIYIKNENENISSEEFSPLLPNLGSECKQSLVFALPRYDDVEHEQYRICVVFFYKDILGNQYYQEIFGIITIDKFECVEEKDLYSIHFDEAEQYEFLPKEKSYEIPSWFNRDETVDEYIRTGFTDYSYELGEALENFMSLKGIKVLNLFESRLLNKAKEFFELPHLDMGRGDLVGAKEIADDRWEYIVFRERAYNLEKKIIYFVTIDIDLNLDKCKVKSLNIYENTLSDNEKLISKFSSKVKRLV